MMQHFTAWITSDPSCLDQPNMDVVVLADILVGEPDDDNAWTSTSDQQFTAATSVPADGGDIQAAICEVADLLTDAGWEITGGWSDVPTGYIATVTRA